MDCISKQLDERLAATPIALPPATVAFIRSIDKPETVLDLLGFHTSYIPGVTGWQMGLLARLLAQDTHFMTIRGGGNHCSFIEDVLCLRKDQVGAERYQLFVTKKQSRYIHGKRFATVHLLEDYDIPADSKIVRNAIELDFRSGPIGDNCASVLYGTPTPNRQSGGHGDSCEKGMWAVGDFLMALGWKDVPPATHILHLGGGTAVLAKYETQLILRSELPAFNALGLEFPFNIAYRDPDEEIVQRRLSGNG